MFVLIVAVDKIEWKLKIKLILSLNLNGVVYWASNNGVEPTQLGYIFV